MNYTKEQLERFYEAEKCYRRYAEEFIWQSVDAVYPDRYLIRYSVKYTDEKNFSKVRVALEEWAFDRGMRIYSFNYRETLKDFDEEIYEQIIKVCPIGKYPNERYLKDLIKSQEESIKNLTKVIDEWDDEKDIDYDISFDKDYYIAERECYRKVLEEYKQDLSKVKDDLIRLLKEKKSIQVK